MMKKRLTACLAALSLLVGLVPGGAALAAPTTNQAAVSVAFVLEGKDAGDSITLAVGETIQLGLAATASGTGVQTFGVALGGDAGDFTVTVPGAEASYLADYGTVTFGSTLTKTGYRSSFMGTNAQQDYAFENQLYGEYGLTALAEGSYTLTLANSSGCYSADRSSVPFTGDTLTVVVENDQDKKTPTATVSGKLTGEYGVSYSQLASQLNNGSLVSVQCEGSTVEGSWSYTGSGRPNAGSSTAAFLFTPSSRAYNTLRQEFSLQIDRRSLTPTLTVTPSEKAYDGTDSLAVGQEAEIRVEDLLQGDDIGIRMDSVTYDSAEVGSRTLTAGGVALAGSDADNYALADGPVQTAGAITPYTGEVAVSASIAHRSHNGAAQPLTAGELTLTVNGRTLGEQDYTVLYYTDEARQNAVEANAVTGSAESAVTYYYSLSGAGNYAGCSFSGGTGSFVIESKPLPTVQSGSLGDVTAPYGQVTLPSLDGITLGAADHCDAPQAGYSLSLRFRTQEGGDYTAEAPTQVGSYGMAVWFQPAEGDTTYAAGLLNGLTATLTITPASGEASVTMADYTYGEAAPAPTLASESHGTDHVTLRYTGRDGTSYDSETAPTGAGRYTVTATFAATDTAAEVQVRDDFEVKALTLTAEMFTLEPASLPYNGSRQTPAVQRANSVLQEEDYTVTGPENPVNPGTYVVKVSGKGNCTGTVELPYTITGTDPDISGLTFSTQYACYPSGSYAGKPLSSITFAAMEQGALAWQDGSQTLAVGKTAYKALYTPKDSHYNAVVVDVTVELVDFNADYGVLTLEAGRYTSLSTDSQEMPLIWPADSGIAFESSDSGVAALTVEGQTLRVEGKKAGFCLIRQKMGDSLVAVIPVYVTQATPTLDGSKDQAKGLAKVLSSLQNDSTLSILTTRQKTELLAALSSITRNSSLSVSQQNEVKRELNSSATLNLLDSLSSALVETKCTVAGGDLLTGAGVGLGATAASAKASGNVVYTAKQTATASVSNALATVELSSDAGQLAAPVTFTLTFNVKDKGLKSNGSYSILHQYGDNNSLSETLEPHITLKDDLLTVSFTTCSTSAFTLVYKAPSSGSGSSGSSATATPAPTAAPAAAATPTPAPQDSIWLGAYYALISGTRGSTVSVDATACDYLPGYVIAGVENTGVSLAIKTGSGSFTLTPAAAKAMNSSYNYSFANAQAIVATTVTSTGSGSGSSASGSATPSPSPTAAPATATPAPTQEPTPSPTPAAQQTAGDDSPSRSYIPLVIAGLVVIVLVGVILVLRAKAQNRRRRRRSGRPSYEMEDDTPTDDPDED